MRLADALRRLPGSGILLSLLARTGAARMFWRYRHLIDGSYRQAPPATDVLDPHREQLWSLIAPFSPQSLLDVGCGDGANLALFVRKAPAVRLDGVDLNPLALAITRRRIIDGGGERSAPCSAAAPTSCPSQPPAWMWRSVTRCSCTCLRQPPSPRSARCDASPRGPSLSTPSVTTPCRRAPSLTGTGYISCQRSSPSQFQLLRSAAIPPRSPPRRDGGSSVRYAS